MPARRTGAIDRARDRRRNGRRSGTVVCCTKDQPRAWHCPHEPFPNGYTCHVPDGPWHGTPGGYTNHLCRCPACATAWGAYTPPSRDGYTSPAHRKGARKNRAGQQRDPAGTWPPTDGRGCPVCGQMGPAAAHGDRCPHTGQRYNEAGQRL